MRDRERESKREKLLEVYNNNNNNNNNNNYERIYIDALLLNWENRIDNHNLRFPNKKYAYSTLL